MKQGEQKSTKELEEQAKNVETFNPRWHDGEYLGPNTLRQKADTEVYGKMEEEPQGFSFLGLGLSKPVQLNILIVRQVTGGKCV